MARKRNLEVNGGEGGIASPSPLRCVKPPPGVLISSLLPHCPRLASCQRRRGRDSNPRYLAVHLISSQAHSASLSPLLKITTFGQNSSADKRESCLSLNQLLIVPPVGGSVAAARLGTSQAHSASLSPLLEITTFGQNSSADKRESCLSLNRDLFRLSCLLLSGLLSSCRSRH